MRLAVLGSGSGGNSLVVESEAGRLLVDAGFSCRQLDLRLRHLGTAVDEIDAVLLTHEHGDHCRGAERLASRYGVAVFATAGTLDATGLAGRAVRSGEAFQAAGFHVVAFGVPHDASEPVGYVIEDDEGCRLGVVADLGSRSQLAWGRLGELDCLVLETNHDLSMLRNGPYPWHLKQRVASRHGHLSNREAAEGLVDLVSERLATVVCYHLSRTNNDPGLAARTIGDKLAALGSRADVVVSGQDEPTDWIDVLRGASAQRPAAAVLAGGVQASLPF